MSEGDPAVNIGCLRNAGHPLRSRDDPPTLQARRSRGSALGLPAGPHRGPVDLGAPDVDPGDPPGIPDVVQGIGIEHDEVRGLSLRHGAEVAAPQQLGLWLLEQEEYDTMMSRRLRLSTTGIGSTILSASTSIGGETMTLRARHMQPAISTSAASTPQPCLPPHTPEVNSF